ncbi:MAG: hypothetical protein DRJ38_10790 [Thermoprotei archaeon]|nr:MAG: hypothetical protein DRJ38_10790 [Thermoprotei archaeon]
MLADLKLWHNPSPTIMKTLPLLLSLLQTFLKRAREDHLVRAISMIMPGQLESPSPKILPQGWPMIK